MNLRVWLRMAFESIRGGNWRFKLMVFGTPALLFICLLLIFPPAALIVPVIWFGTLLLAMFVVAVQLKQLVNIKLQPWLYRSVVNRDQITRLAGELTALGFSRIGFFKVVDRDLFVEGWVRRDWKIYAMITSGNDDADAYVEFSSGYADGGSYCVSGGKTRSFLPRPGNMVTVHHPGKNVEELPGFFLQGRPDYDLVDTPPEKFQETVECEIRRMADYIFKRGRN